MGTYLFQNFLVRIKNIHCHIVILKVQQITLGDACGAHITGVFIGNSEEKCDDQSTKSGMHRTELSSSSEHTLSSSEKPL